MAILYLSNYSKNLEDLSTHFRTIVLRIRIQKLNLKIRHASFLIRFGFKIFQHKFSKNDVQIESLLQMLLDEKVLKRNYSLTAL